MKKSLRLIARHANDYVTGWLSRQPAVKEESITDWILDYFDQHSSDVRYYEFDRYEEARFSGADWDWWFLLNKGCFKVRVQAKKLKKGRDHYSHLARSNKTGYQLDLLLSSSATYNFYPLYALYAETGGSGRCPKVMEPTVLSICSAQEVYELVFGAPRRRIESKDVLSLSIPLECLFQCPFVCDYPSRGPIDLFRHHFRASPAHIGEAYEFDENSFRGYEENVPDIIRSLFERKTNADNENILHEYQEMFAGSRGVTIIRLERSLA